MGNVFDIMGAARRAGFGGLRGLGSLNSYPEVQVVQSQILLLLGTARASGISGADTPAGFSTDGRWGSLTQLGLKRAIRAAVMLGYCGSGYSPSEIDAYGPNAVRDCLKVKGPPVGIQLTDAQITVAQTAWSEWKAAATPTAPAENDRPTSTQETSTDNQTVGTSSGMSTGEKWALGIGIGGALILIGWLIFGDHDW